MHFLKQFRAVIILGALSANTTAAPVPAANASPDLGPLEPREDLTDHLAIVNVYSGGSCAGDSSQFTATGPSTSACYPNGGSSIQVTARYVETFRQTTSDSFSIYLRFPSYMILKLGPTIFSGCSTTTWSGSDCGGSSMGIPDSSCYTVTFAAVQVSC